MSSALKKTIISAIFALFLVFGFSLQKAYTQNPNPLPLEAQEQRDAYIQYFLEQHGVSQEMLDQLTSPSQQIIQLQEAIEDVQSSLEVKTDPLIPGPKEEVTVNIESYSLNLNSSQINWFMDGVLQKSGIGEKSFKFMTKDLGEVSRINVVISTVDGKVFERSIFINPSEMDIVWESTSSAPPFYRGKTLYTHRDNVRVTAIPTVINEVGTRIDPSNLIYKWTVNGSVLGESSGYSKNSIIIEGQTLSRNMRIIAQANTLNEQSSVKERIDLRPTNPQVHIYLHHPRYGVLFDKSLQNNQQMEGRELRVRAFPFFFNSNDLVDGQLAFEWRMNNNPIPVFTDSAALSLRQEDDLGGVSNIFVRIRNENKVRQQAQSSFLLEFEN